eukprot:scaffold396056_cov35-Attheya_sp.AAC.1
MVARIVLNQPTAVECYAKVVQHHGHIIYRILFPAFVSTPLSPKRTQDLFTIFSSAIKCTGILSNCRNEASHQNSAL